jgi:hypothetical protein
LGPTAFCGIGTFRSSIVTTIQSFLSTLNHSSVTIHVTWPEGGNDAERRIANLVDTTWTSMTKWVFGSPTHILAASSTILITH